MNQTIRHTVTILLTLCILLGSFGVALSEQLCLKLSAAQEQTAGCCQKPDPQEAESDDCCTTALSFEKLEPVSSIKVFNLDAPVSFALSFTPLFTTWAPATAPDLRIHTYAGSSPPLFGRQLLHSLHTLIV